MSTSLETLKGKKESVRGYSIDYVECDLYLTRFYGGVERGASLQITFGQDYIQIDNESVHRLIKILQDAFPTD